MQRAGVGSVAELCDQQAIPVRHLSHLGQPVYRRGPGWVRTSIDRAALDHEHPLFDRVVVFTGGSGNWFIPCKEGAGREGLTRLFSVRNTQVTHQPTPWPEDLERLWWPPRPAVGCSPRPFSSSAGGDQTCQGWTRTVRVFRCPQYSTFHQPCRDRPTQAVHPHLGKHQCCSGRGGGSSRPFFFA